MDVTVPHARVQADLVVVADPFGRTRPRLVVAGLRAGALGVLDVADPTDPAAVAAVAQVVERSAAPFALRLDGRHPASGDGPATHARVDTLILTGPDPAPTTAWRAAWPGPRVLVEVTSLAEARTAAAGGADGLVAKGCESGGRVGDTESFVLLQQVAELGLPFWVQGGVGLHTAAGAVAAGARGVVLDAGLTLTRECDLDNHTRRAVRAMDGSETRLVGGHRVFTRPDLPAAALAADTPAGEVAARLGADIRRDLLPLGQDGAMAARLAERHVTVGGVVAAVVRQIAAQIDTARVTTPLAPGHGVSRTHGTRYPVAQGPMTRVSDQAGFARAVADGGGLPFLALALMRGPEVRALLEETASLLGERPWGVGVLGFVPPELREEQLEAVRAVRPPLALIAGGRPSQAAPLEAEGIRTYLHAPSPGLIDNFARAGARRFVFEGRECGGHVGPRSSLVLWEAAVERLLALDGADQLDVLFAGGIHDERSAAAVAAIAAPLVDRGARVGVLMGTAYLFTEEAVAHGAITPTFQQAAMACDATVLLETSPGHATRCAPSPYVDAFRDTRDRLEREGATAQEMWGELEALNLGRLRIASKALVREGDRLRPVSDGEVRSEGMFMLGQVATLRDRVTTVDDLHRSVSAGAATALEELTGSPTGTSPARVRREPERLDIAIVGMAAIMPGARDTDEFWSLIVGGADAVTEVDPRRWDPEVYYSPDATTVDAGRLTPSKWGGFLPEIGFDPLAYGLPPASLAAIEPVQLLALEAASRALADAGYATREFDRSRASVIFGAEAGTDLSAAYGLRAALPAYLAADPERARGRLPEHLDGHLPALTEDSFPGVLANVIAGRIANRLDLGGVNYTVDAACAASLAALDLACKELAGGGSDLVLCGGADLHNGINDFLLFASVHALSPRGRCRTFDAAADGIALGEGVACLALKRVADAERDGDRIYAVVEAVRGASDGRALGLTAPRAEGQQRALERAYAQAGRSPAGLGLVEAHGTGTVVGDATELATLTEVFTRHGATPGSTVLGSVKSQIGHTKCAAGLAGVVKVAQAVYRGVLPPTLGIETPNPHFDPDKSPFRFNDEARPWADEERRAGVSAFGFGGTNFHAVLARYRGDDEPAHGLTAWPAELFLVRAPDAAAGRVRVEELAALVGRIVADDPHGERHHLRDLARTVCDSGDGPVQVALASDDLDHLRRQLAGLLAGEATPADGVHVAGTGSVTGTAPGGDEYDRNPGRAAETGSGAGRADHGGVAVVFPGQGSQRVGMLADLFVAFPRLRRHLRAGQSWAPFVFPARAFTPEAAAAQAAALTDTRVAQPALGIADLAMADLLAQVGITPTAVAGHSYGELVALCAAGAIDPTTLLDLSAARGAAVHEAAASADDPGAMAAVGAPAEVVSPYLAAHPDVVVANHNGPRQTVVAGPTAAVDALVADLKAARVTARRLPVACAFHSPLVAAARGPLAERLAAAPVGAPRLPVWSNTTAGTYPADPDEVRHLVAAQVASPVRFVEQVEAMYAAGIRTFVEAGPGRVLSGLIRGILGDRPHRAVACDVPGQGGVRSFLRALAELAAHGVDVDPAVLFAERAVCLDLDALPRPRPGWTVDGHLVRTAAGDPVAGGLRPATEIPTLHLDAASSGAPGGTTDPAEVVATYLESLREIVAAEREVTLRYLDNAAGRAPGRPGPDRVIDLRDGHATTTAPAVPVTAAPATATVMAAPAAPAQETGEPHEAADAGAPVDLLAVLTGIVADRTGYPADMLAPDLDLEADLSIDSIKRVEIIGEVAERIGLGGAGSDAGAVDDEMVEELARMKTLRGIVDWIDSRTDGAGAGAPAATGVDPAALPTGGNRNGNGALTATDGGHEPPATPTADTEGTRTAPADGDDRPHTAGDDGRPTATADRHDGTRTGPANGHDGPHTAPADGGRAASPGTGSDGGDGPDIPAHAVRAVVELVDAGAAGQPAARPDALAGSAFLVVDDGSGTAPAVAERLAAGGARARIVTPADVAADPATDGIVHLALAAGGGAPAAFATLAPAALRGARWLACVTRSGTVGGEPGLMRALAHEVPDRVVRSIGIDPADGPAAVARAVVDELTSDGPLDVLRTPAGRQTRRTVVTERPGPPTDTPAPLGTGVPALDQGAVVLLTGGARGITAQVALALASAGAAHLELVGRSAPPAGDEPADLADAGDLRSLRTAVLARGQARTPAEVEATCRGIIAARDIRRTVARAAEAGASVRYHQADAGAPGALASVLADVYRHHGRLDGVVHGAGVIEDRVLADKTAESYRRVYATKVDGARALLGAVRSDVGFVVLFGSVSGVFGNRGQVDYSAANDALDALALDADGGRLAGRVLSIDWGPWAGTGMVSGELARAYARRGVGLVEPADGIAALGAELAALRAGGRFPAPQVVVARAWPERFAAAGEVRVGT